MPSMTVWPVSSFVRTRKVGSSSASRPSAAPILSWSARVFGSIETEMTGSGNVIDSSTTGAAGSQSVSPVNVAFRPMTAAMSPALTDEISSRWFACICSSRPIRSRSPLVEFSA